MSNKPREYGDLHWSLWLLLPAMLLLAPVARSLLAPDLLPGNVNRDGSFLEQVTAVFLVKGEGSLFELLTVLFLAIAIIFCLRLLGPARRLPFKTVGVVAAVYLLGLIYFLGEEISWGQHFFQWSTPEAWRDLNEQGETNIHNTAGWLGDMLDQVPRRGLTLFAALGGIVPLVLLRRGPLDPRTSLWAWLMPTMVCVPVGFMAALLRPLLSLYARAYAEIMGGTDVFKLISAGELKECFLALFLLIYIASLSSRARAFVAPSRKSHTEVLKAKGIESSATSTSGYKKVGTE